MNIYTPQASAPKFSADSALEQLLKEWVKERRSKRRWNMLFRTLLLAWLFTSLFVVKSGPWFNYPALTQSHTALIDISGKIMENELANADSLIESLGQAFHNTHAKAVILRINSPGGTPVTADQIFHEIKRLKAEYSDKKIYAVCTDACASAAYYIASAADEIYANPSSLVGSIAVLYSGFGFVDTLQKLGIERRVFASGAQKSFLDPFAPIQAEQVQILKDMLNELHLQFVQDVKQGRGDRLSDHPDLFTGLYWTGIQAKRLGLIDGFGDIRFVARELIQEEKIIEYTPKQNYLERVARQLGATSQAALKTLGEVPFLNAQVPTIDQSS